MEVALIAQHFGAGIVDIQERLQVGEAVRLAQHLDRRVAQRQPMLARQLEHHFRLERALDMQVQPSFGNCADE